MISVSAGAVGPVVTMGESAAPYRGREGGGGTRVALCVCVQHACIRTQNVRMQRTYARKYYVLAYIRAYAITHVFLYVYINARSQWRA